MASISVDPATRSSRWRVLGVTVCLSAAGFLAGWQLIVSDGAVAGWEMLAAVLFVVLFGWLAFSMGLALEGFVASLRRRSVSPIANIAGPTRTAILVPVYNESPTRVFAGVAAMRQQLSEQLATAGTESTEPPAISHFDFFVLSDTTDPEIWLREEWCWGELVAADDFVDSPIGVYYRHRTENISRKAGNIADFCENWGSHYDHMIVLDADSLMSGATMVEMVQRMNADPQLGILQVPPAPIGRRSLFARLQQFSAAIYGPLFAAGTARFAGPHGNYWGHNAILRMAPFMRHCRLPVLQGEPPLGGEILSHDFVEAALMVRSGWKVTLVTDLEGSFEECPTTIVDFAKRDQRWCQGNLQHWRLMLAERIHPMSRLHFFNGILGYVASPLWLLFMLAMLMAGWFAPSNSAVGVDETTRIVPPMTLAVGLFAASMVMLLLPKMLAVVATMADQPRRRSLGGAGRIMVSALVESLASMAIAPIMGVFHTRFVLAVLSGHNVRWGAQDRDERGVGWRESAREFGWMTLGGIVVAVALWQTQPILLAWFSPILVGWVAAIPLAVVLGSRRAGERLQKLGLLEITSERHVEPIVAAQQTWLARLDSSLGRVGSLSMFERLFDDDLFRSRHVGILRATGNQRAISPEDRGSAEKFTTGRAHHLVPAPLRRRLLSDDAWVESLGAVTATS